MCLHFAILIENPSSHFIIIPNQYSFFPLKEEERREQK